MRSLRPKALSQPRLYLSVIIIIAALVSAGLFGRGNKRQTFSADGAITRSATTPDESLPPNDYIWRGRPEEPRKLIIQSLSIDTYVQKLGTDQHQRIASPSNIHFAGWYAASALPGQTGLSIIAGHVDGKRASGVFHQLHTITPGTLISLELGNGQSVTYETFNIQTYPADASAEALFSQDPLVTGQLNLVTCAGRFLAAQNSYEKRTIVSAKLLSQSNH